MSIPSIEGTYKLVRRELPDGTIQVPPLLKGFYSYTKGYRNFSIVWKDEKDKYYSESYGASYKLTDTEYTETSEYLVINDEIGGMGISYDLSNRIAKSVVSIEGNRITFELPQDFEKSLSITLEIERNSMKATGKDLFVDYWEKVS